MSMPNIVAHHSNFKPVNPEEGMGATAFLLTDRVPYTVVHVVSARECIVQLDNVRPDKSKPGGMGHQNWIISQNTEGTRCRITLRNDGKWRQKGVSKRESGVYWLLGHREHYYDWEF